MELEERMCAPAPAPLSSKTKLSSGTKHRTGSSVSCASSGTELVRSCRGCSAVPHTNAALTMPASCGCPTAEHSGSQAPRLPHFQPRCLTPQTCQKHFKHVFPVFTDGSPFNFLIFLTVPYNLRRKGWTGRIRQWNTMQEDAKSVKTPTLSTRNQCQL